MGVKGYGVEALRMTSGDGLSGFSSRSEQAIARQLQKCGFTMQFYDDLVQRQDNVCSDCHKPEKTRIAGGAKRKPLSLGFTDGKPDRLICTTCSSRQRKVKQRERKQTAPKKFLSNEEWWAKNKSQLTPTQLAEFQERENKVLDLEIMMTFWLNDVAEDVRTPLPTLLGQVERDVVAHGLMYCPDLNFHEFHDEVDYGDYTETRNYISYGFSTAIESQLFWDFILTFKPQVTSRCKTPGCPNLEGKAEPWFCDLCSAERSRRSDAHHGFRRTLAEVAPDRPYVVNGQWSTPDTNTKAAWFAKLP